MGNVVSSSSWNQSSVGALHLTLPFTSLWGGRSRSLQKWRRQGKSPCWNWERHDEYDKSHNRGKDRGQSLSPKAYLEIKTIQLNALGGGGIQDAPLTCTVVSAGNVPLRWQRGRRPGSKEGMRGRGGRGKLQQQHAAWMSWELQSSCFGLFLFSPIWARFDAFQCVPPILGVSKHWTRKKETWKKNHVNKELALKAM